MGERLATPRQPSIPGTRRNDTPPPILLIVNRDSAVSRSVQLGLVALGAWTAFFGLEVAMSYALRLSGTRAVLEELESNLAVALLWAVLTVVVAEWHTRVRVIARNVGWLVGMHLPLLVLVTVIDTWASRETSAIFSGQHDFPPFSSMAIFYADFEIVAYLAIVAMTEALLVRRAIDERQRLAQQLEASLGRARLDYLEAQLQPHFLFNSLGAVSELAYDSPSVASRVLHQLIAIFRTALTRTSDEVTLGEEIVGIEPYLDIQRIRFADWLTIEYRIDDAAVDCLLPRFVLQPLIENAIRHGLSGRSAAGRIDISGAVADGALVVRVTDNGVGLDAAAASRSGRGIGLSNVRDRLGILYGDDDRLRLYENSTGGTTAELIVPARRRGRSAESVDAHHAAVADLPETPVLSFGFPTFVRRPMVAIPLVWLCWGLMLTQQSFMYLTLRDRLGNQTWWSIARTDVTSALVWAVLTPLVLALGRVWPLRRDWLALRVIAYAAIGAFVSFLQVFGVHRLALTGTPLTSAAWEMSYLVNFIIFCVLVVVSHHHVLRAWLETREADALALTQRLAAAQERTNKLRAIPPVLLQSLSGIADTARSDPNLTEKQLARLADYLRLALECTDARGITPDRERALDAAVGTLRETGAYTLTLTGSA